MLKLYGPINIIHILTNEKPFWARGERLCTYVVRLEVSKICLTDAHVAVDIQKPYYTF